MKRVIVLVGFILAAPALAQQKLTFDEGADTPYAVAVSGNTAVIGVSGTYDDALGDFQQGVAYVFVRDGDSWTEQAKLKASDGEPYDRFGLAVAIDGDVIAVGAYRAPGPTTDGAVYVFERSGGTWSEMARLSPSGEFAIDEFGSTVALSGDTLLAGAPLEHGVAGKEDSGAAYFFVRSGAAWEKQQRIIPLDPQYDHNFGRLVALSGGVAVISADVTMLGAGAASAYIFEREAGTWSERAKLESPDDPLEYGCSVSVWGDTVVVGAPGTQQEGIAHIYGRAGDSWVEQAKVSTPVQPFGVYPSVSLSGGVLVIGAHTPYPSSTPGAAYSFLRQGAAWSLQPELVPDDPVDRLAFGVATSVSANNVLIGMNSGVYAFTLDYVSGVDAGVVGLDGSGDGGTGAREAGPGAAEAGPSDHDAGAEDDGCSCAMRRPAGAGLFWLLLTALAGWLVRWTDRPLALRAKRPKVRDERHRQEGLRTLWSASIRPGSGVTRSAPRVGASQPPSSNSFQA